MNSYKIKWILIIVALFALSCGGDNDVSKEAFIGRWTWCKTSILPENDYVVIDGDTLFHESIEVNGNECLSVIFHKDCSGEIQDENGTHTIQQFRYDVKDSILMLNLFPTHALDSNPYCLLGDSVFIFAFQKNEDGHAVHLFLKTKSFIAILEKNQTINTSKQNKAD